MTDMSSLSLFNQMKNHFFKRKKVLEFWSKFLSLFNSIVLHLVLAQQPKGGWTNILQPLTK